MITESTLRATERENGFAGLIGGGLCDCVRPNRRNLLNRMEIYSPTQWHKPEDDFLAGARFGARTLAAFF